MSELDHALQYSLKFSRNQRTNSPGLKIRIGNGYLRTPEERRTELRKKLIESIEEWLDEMR